MGVLWTVVPPRPALKNWKMTNATISVRINGEKLAFDHEPSIREVLEQLGAPVSAVAVEVNRILVPKRTHAGHILRDGDEVEVVTFVGGG